MKKRLTSVSHRSITTVWETKGDASERIPDRFEGDQGARSQGNGTGRGRHNYQADHKAVIKVLDQIFATEPVCVLRNRRRYCIASGLNSEAVKEDFLQHADPEQQLPDWVATRITEPTGEPDFRPKDWRRAGYSEYAEGGDLVSMIRDEGSRSEPKDPDTRRGREDIGKVGRTCRRPENSSAESVKIT
jgi:hypothetical protein